jgi:hypothetical protein
VELLLLHHVDTREGETESVAAARLTAHAEHTALAHVREVTAADLSNIALATNVVSDTVTVLLEHFIAPMVSHAAWEQTSCAAAWAVSARCITQVGLECVRLVLQSEQLAVLFTSTSLGVHLLWWLFFLKITLKKDQKTN